MRYHIVYKCGHEENVNLNGRQNSQSYADWLAAGVCKECYQAQKLAERKAYNEAEGLPELAGKIAETTSALSKVLGYIPE